MHERESPQNCEAGPRSDWWSAAWAWATSTRTVEDERVYFLLALLAVATIVLRVTVGEAGAGAEACGAWDMDCQQKSDGFLVLN